jgi:hypothetical protein
LRLAVDRAPGNREEENNPSNQKEDDDGRRDPTRPTPTLQPRDRGMKADGHDDRNQNQREDVPDAHQNPDEGGGEDHFQQRRPGDV